MPVSRPGLRARPSSAVPWGLLGFGLIGFGRAVWCQWQRYLLTNRYLLGGRGIRPKFGKHIIGLPTAHRRDSPETQQTIDIDGNVASALQMIHGNDLTLEIGIQASVHNHVLLCHRPS